MKIKKDKVLNKEEEIKVEEEERTDQNMIKRRKKLLNKSKEKDNQEVRDK